MRTHVGSFWPSREEHTDSSELLPQKTIPFSLGFWGPGLLSFQSLPHPQTLFLLLLTSHSRDFADLAVFNSIHFLLLNKTKPIWVPSTFSPRRKMFRRKEPEKLRTIKLFIEWGRFLTTLDCNVVNIIHPLGINIIPAGIMFPGMTLLD